jgi:hypothetical protein
MSNLQLRTISGLVLASVVLALTWVGGLPFRLLAVAISAAVFYEWTRMTRPAHSRVLWLVPEACMAILLVALGLGVAAVDFLLLALAATVIVAAIGFLRGSGLWDATGIAYASLSGFALAFLRGADHAGLLAILFLFAVVWTTDTLAYFVGRAVGGPKLAPSISPGKTWSGRCGGHCRFRSRRHRQSPFARPCRAPAFGRLADRRSVRIMGEAPAWMQGLQPAHSGSRWRDGPCGRACRCSACALRHRQSGRFARQSCAGTVRGLRFRSVMRGHGFAGFGASLAVETHAVRTTADESRI